MYDTDTKLYYLQSRYYDPFTCRFINADDTAYIGATGTALSANIFTYCENNPVNNVDKKGADPTNIYLRYYYNCYAYAMGYTDRWLHPGKGNINVAINHTLRNPQGELKSEKYLLPTAYFVYKIRDWVEKDFGKIVRKINGRNYSIKKNEYRIAFRVQRMIDPLQKGQKRTTYDFHFMKQDPKTKKWYDKPGSTAVRSLGKINPDKNSSWSNKYNSKTLYM